MTKSKIKYQLIKLKLEKNYKEIIFFFENANLQKLI